MIALGGVACALGGAAWGASGLAGQPSTHLTVSLLMIGGFKYQKLSSSDDILAFKENEKLNKLFPLNSFMFHNKNSAVLFQALAWCS
jgi:hypothetical protein